MSSARRTALLATVAVTACGCSVAYAAFGDTTTNTSNAWQASTQFPPRVDSVPDVFGTGQAGQTLEASTGDFHPAPTSFAYRWLRCDSAGANCVAVGGATSSSYALGAADTASRVRVEVTPSNGAATGTAVVSEPTQSVRGLGLGASVVQPTSANTPTVSGTATVGSSLTLNLGSWTIVGLTFSRQWQRCDATGAACADIAGATGTTYTVATADRGHRLRGMVTASTIILLPNAAVTADTSLVP